MKEKNSEKNRHHDNGETVVLWILISLFLALTTLTVNSYSELDDKVENNFVVSPQPQINKINTSELSLINSKSDSQITAKTLNM